MTVGDAQSCYHTLPPPFRFLRRSSWPVWERRETRVPRSLTRHDAWSSAVCWTLWTLIQLRRVSDARYRWLRLTLQSEPWVKVIGCGRFVALRALGIGRPRERSMRMFFPCQPSHTEGTQHLTRVLLGPTPLSPSLQFWRRAWYSLRRDRTGPLLAWCAGGVDEPRFSESSWNDHDGGEIPLYVRGDWTLTAVFRP